MYKFWLQKYVDEKRKDYREKQQQLQRQFKELKEIVNEEDMYVLQDAKIIGITIDGANRYRNLIQRLNPQIILVEEATEIKEYEIISCLAPNTKHLILIGNDQHKWSIQPTLPIKCDLHVSLLERMINNGIDSCRLSKQHRMSPDIASLFVPHVYADLENDESVLVYENIKGISKNIFFISHSYGECRSERKLYKYEAIYLVNLCRYLLLQGYNPSQISILSICTGQHLAVKNYAETALAEIVKICTVDDFKGKENDIILMSFAGYNEGERDFLNTSDRVCVALSRAKMGLYCVGNFKWFARKYKIWQKIVDILHQLQIIGASLKVVCQNHPDVCSVVKSGQDFDALIQGSCTRPCKFILACGHACPLVCHQTDRVHAYVRCEKTCYKICNQCQSICNHKCFEYCYPCTKVMTWLFPTCKHTDTFPCHQLRFSFCQKACEKKLSCGHACTNRCCDPCAPKCEKEVVIKLDTCGHKVKVKCFRSNDREYLIKVCKKPCVLKLPCGHACTGTCSKCYQGRLHVSCRESCKRILICGHKCRSACYKSCPPCKRLCENRCVHRKCPNKCGEPCIRCTEPCALACVHSKCTSLCCDPCNRLPCNEPCPKFLKCKHPCIGFCGEPCPKQCRVCDGGKVKKVFFGFEKEENSQFILLENCSHIFENRGLMGYLNTGQQGEGEIHMKACPICKVVIRRNWRYENTIKSCLADLEKIKNITYGDNKNHDLQISLLNKIPKTEIYYSVLLSLMQVLSSKKIRSIKEITTMKNVIDIVTQLIEVTDGLLDSHVFLEKSQVQIQNINKLVDYCRFSKNVLVLFVKYNFLTASEQQLQDFVWEVHRLKLAKKLLVFVKNRTVKHPNTHFETMVNCLANYAPFRSREAEIFVSNFQTFGQQYGIVIRNITEMEKPLVLRALDLSQGHWFQCINGHIYCIAVYAGTTLVNKCNECSTAPGGSKKTFHSQAEWLQLWMDLDPMRCGTL